MRNHSLTNIRIAGSGGQGVVVVGNLIARACVIEGKNVVGMVAYGAEMRGGAAHATVIVSDEEIACPFVETPDMAIVLNQPSLDTFEASIVPGGLILLNTSMVQRPVLRTDIEQVHLAATELAHGLGNLKVANIIALGAFIEHTQLLTMDSVRQAIGDLFASKNPKMVELNLKALEVGAANYTTCLAKT
jgi:2-oxoglutarate ferredoxin oxidoreductase subunit gamma